MIPVLWPDFTLLVMNYLRGVLSETVTRTKRDGAVNQLVIATEAQQLETPISRRVSVLMEAWSCDSNGNADAAAAVDLMNRALHELQRSPLRLPNVVRFDQPVGPSMEKDELKVEYAEGSIVLVFSA